MSPPPPDTEVLPLIIIGGGGAAREIAGFAPECLAPYSPVAMVDRGDANGIGAICGGLPVLCLDDAIMKHHHAVAIIAIGNAAIRRQMAALLHRSGIGLATLVHRSVISGPRTEIGAGTIIGPGCIIMCDVRIGKNVYINIGCTVSHDTVIEDFATLSPGVSLPGAVHIESGAFIGTGASFVNGRPGYPLRIGRDAIVGAGACVTADVAAGQTVVGVPARPAVHKRRRP